MESFMVSEAKVQVNGETVNGETLPQGQDLGDSTRFEATLVGLDGPERDLTVQVEYERPDGMMMNADGTMLLYDDGTHGDPTPGDGIYCYEDRQGDYGFHMRDAPMGDYHYGFFATDRKERHSRHVDVIVTLSSPSGNRE
jgi:hypothetical protein